MRLLGLTTLTIPLVVGAWLIHFLITGYGMSASAARALAFGLFRISAVMREVAGRMTSGDSPSMLVIVGLALGAGGALPHLGVGDSTLTAVISSSDGGRRSLPYRSTTTRPSGSSGPAGGNLGHDAGQDRDLPDPRDPDTVGAATASGGAPDLAFAGLAAFTVLTLIAERPAPVPPRSGDA